MESHTDKTRCGRVSGTAERTTHVPRNTHPRSEPRPEHGMPPPKRAATAPFLSRAPSPAPKHVCLERLDPPTLTARNHPAPALLALLDLREQMEVARNDVRHPVVSCKGGCGRVWCVGCVGACKDRVPRAVWGGVRTGGLRDAVEGVGEKGVRESECWQVHHCAK